MKKYLPVLAVSIADLFLLYGFITALRSAENYGGWVLLVFCLYVLIRVSIHYIDKNETKKAYSFMKDAEHNKEIVKDISKAMDKRLRELETQLSEAKDDVSKLKLGQFSRR